MKTSKIYEEYSVVSITNTKATSQKRASKIAEIFRDWERLDYETSRKVERVLKLIDKANAEGLNETNVKCIRANESILQSLCKSALRRENGYWD